ncbi:MAG: T9SS type A sorting domain-containing protein [Flexibacteraceae bacterium]|jgi:hypothetical protein
MKKILLVICVLAGTLAANAQSLRVTNMAPLVNGLPTASLLESNSIITNTSTQDLAVKVTSQILQQAPGSFSNFCWGINCYPPTVTTSPDAIALSPGQSNNSFKADYLPLESVGVTRVKYCFFVVGNPTDSVCTVVTFDTRPNSASSKLAKAEMKAYPNPATDVVSISYPVAGTSATIEVVNIIGKVVFEAPLQEGTTNTRLNVKELPNGQYFVSVKEANKRVATTRLIVK